MSTPGWYPDPGGLRGQYRYWDGSQWSTTVTATPFGDPAQPSPAQGPTGPTQPLGNRPYDGGQPLSSHPGVARAGTISAGGRGRAAGWWLLVLALLAGLVFGGFQLLGAVNLNPFGGAPAASNPSPNACPTAEPTSIMATPALTSDGRVKAGQLSYPLLGSPWGAPQIENRMAFGRGVFTQNVTVERNFQPNSDWVASVLVGELVAGDGFFSPQDGTERIVKCAMGSFYSDAVVTRDDKVSKAVTVDGKDGWVIETHLSFNIPGLKEKGETAIFEVVATSAASSSVFYASIPDSRPELLTQARQVQSQLRVEA